jgi:hypothetical protein
MRRTTLLLLILLGGCSAIDPYERQGVWRPLNANEANLRIHVADPAMLERGVDDHRSDGRVMAQAVDRYRNDRVRPLPASSVSRIQPTGQGATAAPVGGGGDGGR